MHGCVSDFLFLSHSVGPEFDDDIESPSDAAVLQNDTVILVCGKNLAGFPNPDVEWRDNNGALISNGGRYTFSDSLDVVSLTISDTTASDAGNWSCNVSVTGPNGESTDIQLERIIELVVVGKLSCDIISLSCETSSSAWVSCLSEEGGGGGGGNRLSMFMSYYFETPLYLPYSATFNTIPSHSRSCLHWSNFHSYLLANTRVKLGHPSCLILPHLCPAPQREFHHRQWNCQGLQSDRATPRDRV